MPRYSREMKETIVAKLCSPRGPTYSQLARESGISLATLHNWVKQFGNKEKVKEQKRLQSWNAVERLQIVFEAQQLDEDKLGAFLRLKGLRSHDIEEWKAEAIVDAKKEKRGRPVLDPELVTLRQENARLKKDLHRKDKALAEAAALIILKKRFEEIWDKDEDVE